MRERLRRSWLALALMIALTGGAVAAAGGGGGGGGRGDAEALAREAAAAAAAAELAAHRVTLQLTDTPIEQALRLLFEGTGQSYVLEPSVHVPPVNLTLNDVDLGQAIRVICDAAGLFYRRADGRIWVFSEKPEVTVAGTRVPLVGATAISGFGGGGGRGRSRVLFDYSVSGPNEVRQIVGAHYLVDLEIENAPLAEVAAKLAKQGPPDLKIVADDSVSKDIKITAKVFKMSLDRLLGMLAEQANLDLSVSPGGDGRESIIYFVPKPELSVTGTGAPWEAVGRAPPVPPVDRSVLDALRGWEIDTGESVTRLGFRPCPQCANLMQLHWKYCPFCGVKLPSDEEPTKKSE